MIVDTIDNSLANMLESLYSTGILASNIFHDIGVLNVGDSVTLGGKELTILGFINSLPGTFSIPTLDKFAVANTGIIEDINYTVLSRSVLVKTANRQPESIVDAIAESIPKNMTQSYTAATMSSAMLKFAKSASVSQIAENVMNLLFVASIVSFVFAIATIGVMAYNDAIERRRLDALLRIRGVTRWQLLDMILSEALTFFLFSLIIGFFAGFVMASGYTAYFSAAFPIHAFPSISYVLLIQLLSLLAVYLLAFIIPSISAMRKTSRFHAY
jgi:ABC-type antimicrobial peptide transport system permease subunit